MSNLNFPALVAGERFAQDAQWGGPEHDDTHTPSDWLRYIGKQIDNVRRDWRESSLGRTPPRVDYRHSLVKIAALAQAAFESSVRKSIEKETTP